MKAIQSCVMSEEEFLSLPEKIGIFSFLHEPGEDIYDANDGEELNVRITDRG